MSQYRTEPDYVTEDRDPILRTVCTGCASIMYEPVEGFQGATVFDLCAGCKGLEASLIDVKSDIKTFVQGHVNRATEMVEFYSARLNNHPSEIVCESYDRALHYWKGAKEAYELVARSL